MTAEFNEQVMNDYVNAVMTYSGDVSKDRFWSTVKMNKQEYDILYDFFPTYITVTLYKYKNPLVMTRFLTSNGWPHYDIVGWVLNNISDDFYSDDCDYDDECSYDSSDELFDYLEECGYDDENDDDDENNE